MAAVSRDSRPGLPVHWRVILTIAYGAALGTIAWLFLDGAGYYGTELVQRPRHELFWQLKPGGSRGHRMGLIGASLLVLMLVYSVRKRARFMRRWGPLRAWLHFHIFCGITGTLLIVLHSSFKVQGLVAVSFWSMILVALSGVLGRYLYLQIPRTRAGDELSLEEAREGSRQLARRLEEEHHLPPALIESLDRAARWSGGERSSLAVLLLRLPFEGLRLRWRLAALQRRLRAHGRLHRDLTPLLTERARLERRIFLWSRLQRLFHYWHVFHKPFAVLMYLFLVLHVAIVVLTGYAWVD